MSHNIIILWLNMDWSRATFRGWLYHSGEALGRTPQEDTRAAAPSDAANAAVFAAVDAAAGARVARCADGAHPVALKD